jgi:glyoxylase-like metal-dependent hydrolase (beta-lactamase superfamily II)
MVRGERRFEMSVQKKISARLVLLVLFLLVFAPFAYGQDFSKVEIKTIKVADGVYMLVGRGGNIGVSAGEDGVFMIDDQFAPLTDKIKNAVASISDKPIRFLLNTHWHPDHTGGNENLGKGGSVIVAHENVRKRLSTEQFMASFKRTIPPKPKGGLPVITFTKDLTFHLNGDEIFVFHVNHAHTDGDSIIFFRKTNVVHMGDTFFSGFYPFIDISSGGSINGIIDGANQVLPMIDNTTKVIPGHGRLSNKESLMAYRDMLTTIRDRISKHVKAGDSLDKTLASSPTQGFDATWGKGFIKPEAFVKIVYQSLSK